ncbi:uncharacterized protein LOC143217011 [Lasioglossum baleicum]|uniref:uncharacterized protein LOC143217011 n=1 Tax=Lasioglossum baleicum TaxID=434251 RepID=UPI003FCE04DE
MEVKKRNKKVDTSKQISEKSLDPLQEEKDKLKKEIAKLRSIIPQLECELDLFPFKNVKIDSKSNALDTCFDLDNSQIPDVNVELELELFRFAGFRCLQFTEQEFVFNLSPSNKYDKEYIYGVQVLYKDTKWSLGKWTMPMSIDLEDVVGQFSNNIRDVPNFVRTCRHYVDCYFIRCEQFKALKDTISNTKNSTLQTSDGYTHMMINLIGVHSVEDDDYINAVIHIEYNIDAIKPSKVDIDLQNEQLNAKAKEQFKQSVKCFKSMDLSTAFEKMWNDSPFTWSQEIDEDSPLEIDYSSSSNEEGYLKNWQQRRTSTRKRQRKTRKGDLYISRNVERNDEPAVSQNEKGNKQNPSQYSTNENKKNKTRTESARPRKGQKKQRKGDLYISRNVEKSNEPVASQSKKRNTQNSSPIQGPSTSGINKNKENVTSTSNVHKLYEKNNEKLKQVKLNFRSIKTSHVSPGTSRKLVTPDKFVLHRDVDEVITSTPMHHNGSAVMETADLDDISTISIPEQTARLKSIKKRKTYK